MHILNVKPVNEGKKEGGHNRALTMIANWVRRRKHHMEWLQFRYKIVIDRVIVPTL